MAKAQNVAIDISLVRNLPLFRQMEPAALSRLMKRATTRRVLLGGVPDCISGISIGQPESRLNLGFGMTRNPGLHAARFQDDGRRPAPRAPGGDISAIEPRDERP